MQNNIEELISSLMKQGNIGNQNIELNPKYTGNAHDAINKEIEKEEMPSLIKRLLDRQWQTDNPILQKLVEFMNRGSRPPIDGISPKLMITSKSYKAEPREFDIIREKKYDRSLMDIIDKPNVMDIINLIGGANKEYDEGHRLREPSFQHPETGKGTKLYQSDVYDQFMLKDRLDAILSGGRMKF